MRMRLALAVALLSVLVLTGALEASPAYPVRVGPTGRYLVDQNGAPFLIVGDSPQAMIGRLSEAEAERFFANRQAHGFNTVWINLLCSTYIGCNGDATTFDGIPPFNVPGDLTTPNEAYFARVDAILRLAARYGFLVILDPAETGDWLAVLYANGEDGCRAYGQYLGQRYAGFDNIVWMHGNDYQEWGPDADRFTTAVARGIKDFDGRHLQTVQLNFRVSSSTDDPAWIPLIDLNAAYSYEPVYAEILRDYNRGDGLPVFLVESGYEFEAGEAQAMRAQAYWAVLSGATGQLFGNRDIWPFLEGWEDALDSPGAVQMANFTTLFQSRAWYDLVPDQDHSVVTSGRGDFGESDYVTAARTPDGRLVMAYVPSARTVTVDMGRLSGPVTARWYDPTSGAFVAIADAMPNGGLVDFETPGANAEGLGYEDWVLVLETAPGSTPSFIELSTASDSYGAGDQLEVSLRAFNAAQQPSRELFVGVFLPDARTIVYFSGQNRIGGAARVDSLGDLRSFTVLASGQLLELSGGNPVVSFRVPEGMPAGTYAWFAGLAPPGAFADGISHPGDVDVLVVRAITVRP